VAKNCVGVR